MPRERNPRPVLSRIRISALSVAALLLLAPSAQATIPDPGATGPMAVGHSTAEAVDPDRGDRTLDVDVWYPVDPADAVGELTLYPLISIPPFISLGITSDIAIDDLPVAHGFFRPLVLFSHGSGGLNVQSIVLMETLASHGFIVVAPNHTGNSTFDGPNDLPYEDSATDRPKDISFLIDWIMDRSWDPMDPLFLQVNPFAIGVSGHSFGGFTTVAMAAGYGESAFGPVPPDPRVRAIVPVSAVTGLFTDEELEGIDIPILLLGGTLDTAVPIDPNHTRAFGLVSSRASYRVDVQGATHTHFAGVCDFADLLFFLGIPIENWGNLGAAALVEPYLATCIPPAFPIEESLRIQNLYTVSFFKRHLIHDVRYQRFLTKGYATAHEPDIEFFVGGHPLGCGLGMEIAVALPVLALLRRRRFERR